jgi:hypothetical protein
MDIVYSIIGTAIILAITIWAFGFTCMVWGWLFYTADEPKDDLIKSLKDLFEAMGRALVWPVIVYRTFR